MRGVEDAAPYTGDGGAVQAGGVEPRPYAWIGGAVRGEYGLPRQPVGWLAMTGIFGMGVQGWRGKGSARPSPIDPPRL